MKVKTISGAIAVLLVLSSSILGLATIPVAAFPGNWTVDDDRMDFPGADFTSIQDAIDAATSGDTISVYPGTYSESILIGKALTITSASGAEETIIQGLDPELHNIQITADTVVLDGFTIEGPVTYSHNSAIHLAGVASCTIINNILISPNTGIGLLLENSYGNTIINNQLSRHGDNIQCLSSTGNTISGNSISYGTYNGILLCDASSDNTITGNIFTNDGILVSKSYHNTIENNEVDGKPLVYLEDVSDVTVDYAGQVILVNCERITVENLDLSRPTVGVELWETAASIIRNNRIVWGNHYGVYMFGSHDNKLIGNELHGYFALGLEGSEGNIITENDISRSSYGLQLWGSNGNRIYLNDFVDNAYGSVGSHDSSNIWNSQNEIVYTYGGEEYIGYLGNYWGDYVGDDFDGNGIGETPYSMNSETDEFPLILPFENYIEASKTLSYAIITDLHIGRGYEIYRGEEYYLTNRLRKTVEWINSEVLSKGIKFVAVLGDLSDHGTSAEITKAREILNGLKVPFFPIVGNHDVMDNIRVPFCEIFDEVFFQEQCYGLGVNLFSDFSFGLRNYAFDFLGVRFAFLDFAQDGAVGYPYFTTKLFLQSCLSDVETDSVILFTHHPLDSSAFPPIFLSWDWVDEISGWQKVKANFAGHVHGFYDPESLFIPLINPNFMDASVPYTGVNEILGFKTEALMVAGNREEPTGIVRLVEIQGTNLVSNEVVGDFPAVNPYIIPHVYVYGENRLTRVDFDIYPYTKRFEQIEYDIDFGDGESLSDIAYTRPWWWPPVAIAHYYEPIYSGQQISVSLTMTGFVAADSPTVETITTQFFIPQKNPDFAIVAYCPADLMITDPDGLIISKSVNEIPDSIYDEIDLDGDGELDDIILLSQWKTGDYQVIVIPEPNASPTDTYTLELFSNGENAIMAEDVLIENIPTQSYIVRSTKTEVRPIVQVTADFKPDTLNLDSKGKWVETCIELPIGHGYDINNIDLGSILLNGQIQAESWPWTIGDYDMDGIPDLMVKFDRALVCALLDVGEQVTITISGRLLDDRLFEGTDVISVIRNE